MDLSFTCCFTFVDCLMEVINVHVGVFFFLSGKKPFLKLTETGIPWVAKYESIADGTALEEREQLTVWHWSEPRLSCLPCFHVLGRMEVLTSLEWQSGKLSGDSSQ